MSTNYDVNYDDKRFKDVKADEKAALTDLETHYGKQNANGTYTGGAIGSVEDFYQKQIDAAEKWGKEQAKNQQAATDLAIEKINQQRAQAEKDYTKEQSGAYTDWKKQSNPYGANAEAMAAQGMANTGYAESSQVSMYNTWQMRVTAAREAIERARLNYDNQILEAKLQNDSKKAEIAFKTLQTSLELALEGFQYKNTLISEMMDRKQAVKDTYYARYQDVLKQINTENALAEEVRQHNESMAEEVRQFNQLHPVVPIDDGSGSGGGSSKKGYSMSRDSYKKKLTNDEKKFATTTKTTKNNGTADAEAYLNKLISSGASKDKVSNEIALALRNGTITKQEAAKLRQTFTPRGLQY